MFVFVALFSCSFRVIAGRSSKADVEKERDEWYQVGWYTT